MNNSINDEVYLSSDDTRVLTNLRKRSTQREDNEATVLVDNADGLIPSEILTGIPITSNSGVNETNSEKVLDTAVPAAVNDFVGDDHIISIDENDRGSFKYELLDVSLLSKVLIFLFVLQVTLLICSYVTDLVIANIRDLDTGDILFAYGPLTFDENMRLFYDRGENFIYFIFIMAVYVGPILRLCAMMFIAYVFINHLGSTSIPGVTIANNAEEGSSLSEHAIDFQTECDEIKLSPWSGSDFFSFKNSNGSKLKWAQNMLYICSFLGKLQLSQMLLFVIIVWLYDLDLMIPNGEEYINARMESQPREALFLFDGVSYPTFLTLLLLSWMLIRWLNVYKRNMSAKDHISLDAINKRSFHSGAMRSEPLDDTMTTIDESLIEPLLQTQRDVSDHDSNVLTRIFRKDRTFVALILVNFSSWIILFLANAKILKVECYDGILLDDIVEPVRNVSFWQLLSEFYDKTSYDTGLKRLTMSFLVITFCIVLPTIRSILMVILEVRKFPFFNNGHCRGEVSDENQSASQTSQCSYDEIQWHRKLYLTQKYLFMCSGDVFFVICLSFMISIMTPFMDVAFNGTSGYTFIMMKAFWQFGNNILLAWGASSLFLHRAMIERHDYILYKQ